MSRLTDAIAAVSARLPGPGKLAEQRAAATEAFLAAGLPGVRDEKWRYTDLSQLAESDLQFATPDSAAATNFDLLPIDGNRIAFVNGCLAESLTSIDSDSAASIRTLGSDWNALTGGFPRFAEILEHPLGRLNTATAQHGLLVRTNDGADIAELIYVVLAQTGAAPLALQPRIVLDLAVDSAAKIVIHYVSDAGSNAWTNAVVEIRQRPGSRLELLQLQDHGRGHTHTGLISAALERDASAKIGCFDLGASLARNDIDIALNGHGARADVFGAFLPIEAQHIDTHVFIDHASADTQSTTWFRGIAGERSRGVFNGKVIVRPDAQRISADQRNDNLLLARNAEIDTKPELEIYADDVRCSHGATVGELDEQHLFYLRSRGIDEPAARALLTYAFARTAAEHIGEATLREWIAERIAKRLPEHERWERLD